MEEKPPWYHFEIYHMYEIELETSDYNFES